MKQTIFVFAVLALALPLGAQEDTDFNEGEVNLAVVQRDSDTISSKFLEYRDIPQGGQVPFLRLRGKKGDLWYDIVAEDAAQRDQQYRLLLRNDSFKLEGNYVMIPHNFGNGGKSLLRPTSESAYRLSDDLQGFFQSELEAGFPGSTSYENILALVTPSLDAAPADIDLRLERGRNNISFSFAPKDASYDLGVTYFHERRSGTRAANGTSFGFFNVVETPEPLRYITQDFGINGAVSGSWGVARAAVHFNDFKSAFAIFDWDNPFTAVDGTGPRAYLAPGAFGGLDAPATGRLALPPDNKAITGTLGATFRIGSQTRLTVDGTVGQWKQNEEPFIGYTTNTAIFLPDGQPATTAPLPANRLDGKIDTTSLSAFFTTRLADNFRLNARYRRYDLENKTPRLSFPGYVRFDAVWEEIPRISVPYGYANDYFDATLIYDFGKASIEGGYKYTRMDRTFRETEKTTENGFRLVLDVQGTEWVTLRGLYELAQRDFDGSYDTEKSEHASYLDAEGTVQQPALRRYDQAKRDLQRFGGTLQIAPPSGKATLFFHYIKTQQEFDTAPVPLVIEPGAEQPLGLVDSDYETFTIEGDFVPSDRATFYAFYSRENIDDFQRGRQSGGTLNLNPEDTWTSTVADKADTFGAGFDFVLVPDRWDLGLFARWQKVDGDNSFTGPRETEDIPLFDDTELSHIRAWLKYHVNTAWAVTVGGFYEDYDIQDAQTDGTLNYMPGSFFLATNLGDYQAWVGWINLKYSWQ